MLSVYVPKIGLGLKPCTSGALAWELQTSDSLLGHQSYGLGFGVLGFGVYGLGLRI